MASILKVDDLRGNTAAGDITITDGSATMKLQAGVAKVYYKINQSTPATDDSLGFSSFTDNGTGNFTATYTNAFDSTHYGITSAADNWHDYFSSSPAASSVGHAAGNSSHSLADSVIYGQMTGDLA